MKDTRERLAVFPPGRQASPSSSGGPTVGLVVGSPLEDDRMLHCGVRDYAVCLAAALRDAGVAARVIAPDSWGLRDGLSFVRALRSERLDILHLQYPSIGHRRSLLPHTLGLTGAGRRFVVTVHEHSALPRAQRAANTLFRGADRLVFTTDYEARTFGAAPGTAVIPIGSNVPTYPGAVERDDTVLYFGQIRPGKGIEDFIALARLSAAGAGPNRFVVIGSAPPRWRDYCQLLRAQAQDAVSWVEDAPALEVAQMMASAFAAFLPFRDGAGLRRGSLMAALSNGLPVIAPFGPSTTDELRAVLLPADTPKAALLQLQALRGAPALRRQRAASGYVLAQTFSWETIAERHVDFYRDVLARMISSARTPLRTDRAPPMQPCDLGGSRRTKKRPMGASPPRNVT